MIETTTTSPITLSSIIHISLTFDKLLNSWLQLQRRNPSCLWGLFPFQRCPAPSELTDSDFRKEIVRCFFREITGRWNKLPCNGSFSKCEWAGHGATDNLHRLETSTSVSSFGFLGLPSASFAAFPLKFVCKRLCGLHCRPQAKARGKKKRILFIYSSVIWGRQACRTGEKHREAFCIQRSVHRAYHGACPWQSQHSDQGHFGRNRNATCLAPPVTWTGQHGPQSRNWATCSKHFSQDCLHL